jgi:hypothetical protein
MSLAPTHSPPIPLKAKLFLARVHMMALRLAPENVIDCINYYRYDPYLPRLETDAVYIRLIADPKRWFEIRIIKSTFDIRTSEKFCHQGSWGARGQLSEVRKALQTFFAAK